MCTHQYTANYKRMPRGMGVKCPVPDLYARAPGPTSGETPPALPVDASGECIFHSRDVDWKRDNDFVGHFARLVQLLNADTTAKHFDFAEFVLVGAGPDRVLRIAETVFLKQAYFPAALFLNSVQLDRVGFPEGANFQGAVFVGGLTISNAQFGGLDFGRVEFRQPVTFTKVELTNFTFFARARFVSATNGHQISFDDVGFDGLTDFSEAVFNLDNDSLVRFRRCRFEGPTDFTHTEFRCQLVFADVRFAGVIEFVDTLFDEARSTARHRGFAVEFNRIEVAEGALLRFESTEPSNKLFKSDVQMSFKDEATPAGMIRFENVNFNNIAAPSRQRLMLLTRPGKVIIGPGCLKYRFQTPVVSIDVSEGNAPLIEKLCQTFTHYFTVSNGFNLGFEVVERTSTAISFFYFTDEDLSKEEFTERLAASSERMWRLLSVQSPDQLQALERPVRGAVPGAAYHAIQQASGPPAIKESMMINAVDCVTAMIAIFFGAGIRIAMGRWKESDTRALRRATQFGDDRPQVAAELHGILVDRYTGRQLFDISGQQHAGRILTYRDDPVMDIVDVAILTAIEVERKAVCEAFGLNDGHRVYKGSRVYWRGTLPTRDGKRYGIVVAQAADAANIDAALLTNDLLHDWRPGAALLVGIAATTDPNKVKLGDVVVASEVYYYERGKATPGGMKPEPKIILSDATLWGRVTTLPSWPGILDIPRPDGTADAPKVHFGVIASGEKVIADAQVRDEISSVHRKIVAIEMEGYGFSRAVWQSFDQVRHLDIRAICDDGSKSKGDGWHGYAATAAAQFARHFLLDQPISPKAH